MQIRQHLWELQRQLDHWRRMQQPENRQYRSVVINDLWLWASGGTRPVHGCTREAIHAAAAWLFRAQEATPDDGVSLGYFPCDRGSPWRPSYPETTGYIAQTLLEYSRLYHQPDARSRALAAMRWEAQVQMESGAVQGGWLRPADEQQAAVFNTGMVLQGWTAAWRETKDQLFMNAGEKAAHFLLHDMTEDGHYQTHGPFVASDLIKAYNVLCSWALFRFAEDTEREDCRDAAIRNAEATVRLQNEKGWFSDNCLTHPMAPLTHTIGYTLQGLLEIGALSGRSDFIDAVRLSADQIIVRIRENGYLAGRFDSQWAPRKNQSCLTGSAQLAIVFFRLSELTNENRYRDAAIRLTDFLKALQRSSADPGVDGALAGTFPVTGFYMSGGYPNWSTKYLLDALMMQDQLD